MDEFDIETQDTPRKARVALPRRVILVGCLAVLLLLMVLGYCVWYTSIYAPGQSFSGELPELQENEIKLSDELRRDVTHLSEQIGPRSLVTYPKLNQAADWIEEQLVDAGYDVQRQQYTVRDLACFNLEAEIRGATNPEEIILVGAHYDSYGGRPGLVPGTPGANDNATGMAALLALARRFADSQPDRTLRFVAFTNEEPPYFKTDDMGSLVYARRCRKRDENLVAVLSLETMGYFTDEPDSQQYPSPFDKFYPSTGNFIGVVGDVGSRPLIHQVIESFRKHGEFPSESGALPAAVAGVGWSDHWSFWQEGYQGVMITDTAIFRYPYYHMPGDTPDKLNFEAMARVVDGLEAVIIDLASVENAP